MSNTAVGFTLLVGPEDNRAFFVPLVLWTRYRRRVASLFRVVRHNRPIEIRENTSITPLVTYRHTSTGVAATLVRLLLFSENIPLWFCQGPI